MAGRIFIHVGLQKTGTSYLQGIVFQSVDQLAALGVAVVPATKRRTFWLMLDVRGRYRPDFDPSAVTSSVAEFAALMARTSAPDALLTEESLGPATSEQIARLLAACGDREVHVIATVRDLARQIPSAWQESLKAGSSNTFETYLSKLRRHQDTPGHAFWRQKDVPRLLGSWAEHVPSQRIHVVTVPPSGSDPALLLERFCEVLGVDPQRLDREVVRTNQGLRHVGAEVLRRVNEQLAPTHRKRDVYGDVGKRYLSTQILAPQAGEPIRVPVQQRGWIEAISRRHVDYICSSGFAVVGDVADLMPDEQSFGPANGQPSEAEVSAVATTALAIVVADEMDRRRAAARSNVASEDQRAEVRVAGLARRIRTRLRR